MAGLVIDPDVLEDLVEAEFSAPFSWGRGDCSLSPCNVWRRLLGVDPCAAVRGRYSSAAEARAVGTVEERAAEAFAALGWPEIDPAEASPADAGLVRSWLAIRMDGYWAARGRRGVVPHGLDAARRAWRAGG